METKTQLDDLATTNDLGGGAYATASGTELSNVTAEDVKAFVGSLNRQGTPWAIGCAAVMTSIWSDREKAVSAIATLTQENIEQRQRIIDQAFEHLDRMKRRPNEFVESKS